VKMDNPNITIEEYIRLKEEKARRRTIVINDTLTSEATLSCEPTVSSLNNNEIDFRISFDESDDEDCTDNDDDKVDIEHSSRDLSVKPLPDVINTDVGAYAHGANKLLETNYCSEDQYAVSIKEDTVYPCLHSPKTTKGMKLNTPYPEDSIRCIQDMESI
ncbi:hypothetical protein Tco_1097232, partial [Tanacetum coccineum]